MITTSKYNKRFYLWLRELTKPHILGIFIVLLLGLIVVGFQLLEPWPLKILVDSVFGTVPAPGLLKDLNPILILVVVAVSIVLIYGLQSALSLFEVYYSHKVIFRMDLQLGKAFFNKILHLSPRFIDKQRTGDYTYRLNAETGEISNLVVGLTAQMLHGIVMLIGIEIIMATFDFTLALITLLILPFLYYSIKHFTPLIERQSTLVERNNSLLYSYTTEAIDNVALIQSFNKQKTSLRFFQNLLRRNLSRQLTYIITDEKFSLLNDIIATISMAILVIVGALKVYYHHLTIGELLIFLTYLSFLYQPLELISSSIGEAKTNLAAAKRVYKLFRVDYSVKEALNPVSLSKVTGAISCQQLTFQYGSNVILHDVCMSVAAGEKIAITGPSGSGKTSLLSLLGRYYDPTSGSIKLDETDISSVSLDSLRDQFSIVSQDAPMLATTIARNIAYAVNRPVLDDEILRVAKAADAFDFVMGFPKRFDTSVGEHGNMLSGGQRQRVAIARAFLKEAPILLLDEPTSALDEESERSVMNALFKLMEHKTVIVVTHSQAILEYVDKVYWLQDGRLAEHTTSNVPVATDKSLHS